MKPELQTRLIVPIRTRNSSQPAQLIIPKYRRAEGRSERFQIETKYWATGGRLSLVRRAIRRALEKAQTRAARRVKEIERAKALGANGYALDEALRLRQMLTLCKGVPQAQFQGCIVGWVE